MALSLSFYICFRLVLFLYQVFFHFFSIIFNTAGGWHKQKPCQVSFYSVAGISKSVPSHVVTK